MHTCESHRSMAWNSSWWNEALNIIPISTWQHIIQHIWDLLVTQMVALGVIVVVQSIAVKFIENPHNRNPITKPNRWAMGCLSSRKDCDVHYDDIIMSSITSLITSLTIVYSNVYSDADQRKHQSSVKLAFVWGIHRGPVNSPHKWPVTRKIFHLMTSSCVLPESM